MNDIINEDYLLNTSTMQDEFKKELKLSDKNDNDEKIKELFMRHHELSIDKIITGLWNLHQIENKRTWYIVRLNVLRKSGFINKVAGTKQTFIINDNIAGIKNKGDYCEKKQ